MGSGPGGIGDVEIHVGEGGGAAFGHLGTGQTGAPIDDVAVEVFLFGPNPVVEPVGEGLVVGVATEEAHGGMGVHVGKRGEGRFVAPVNMNSICRHWEVAPDAGNAVILYQDIGNLLVQKDTLNENSIHLCVVLEGGVTAMS